MIRMLGEKTRKDSFILSFSFLIVAVVVAFFICWIPFHSQRLMFVVVTLYGEWTGALQQAQHVLFMVSGDGVRASAVTS